MVGRSETSGASLNLSPGGHSAGTRCPVTYTWRIRPINCHCVVFRWWDILAEIFPHRGKSHHGLTTWILPLCTPACSRAAQSCSRHVEVPIRGAWYLVSGGTSLDCARRSLPSREPSNMSTSLGRAGWTFRSESGLWEALRPVLAGDDGPVSLDLLLGGRGCGLS
jgi:hypothetical protein